MAAMLAAGRGLEERANAAVVAYLRRRDAELVPEALAEVAVAREPELQRDGAKVAAARREALQRGAQAKRLPKALEG
jgi:hypothetical protein